MALLHVLPPNVPVLHGAMENVPCEPRSSEQFISSFKWWTIDVNKTGAIVFFFCYRLRA